MHVADYYQLYQEQPSTGYQTHRNALVYTLYAATSPTEALNYLAALLPDIAANDSQSAIYNSLYDTAVINALYDQNVVFPFDDPDGVAYDGTECTDGGNTGGGGEPSIIHTSSGSILTHGTLNGVRKTAGARYLTWPAGEAGVVDAGGTGSTESGGQIFLQGNWDGYTVRNTGAHQLKVGFSSNTDMHLGFVAPGATMYISDETTCLYMYVEIFDQSIPLSAQVETTPQ